MNVLLLPQVSTNKGDRAVLHFMLDGLIDCGVTKITVATDNPMNWSGYRTFRGHSIEFIPFAWMTLAEAEARVPFHSVRYYCLRARSKARERFYLTVGYAVVRAAIVKHRWRRAARTLAYLCNRRLWHSIQRADLALTTGGHRLTTLLQPDVVGSQSFGMALVVLAGRRMVHWSQTIGGFEFKAEDNRLLISAIINHADRVYVRDEESLRHMEGLLADRSKASVTYDSVFGLGQLAESYSAVPPSARPKRLGISVYTGARGREVSYAKYVESLATLVKRCVADGYEVVFFPMHLRDKNEMQHFEDIRLRSGYPKACRILAAELDTAEHLREVAQCRLFVGHKTHSIIFALTCCTPLIAIAYHFKTLEFMRQCGLSEYAFPERETSEARLIALYERLERNLASVYDIEWGVSRKRGMAVNRDFRMMVEAFRETMHEDEAVRLRLTS